MIAATYEKSFTDEGWIVSSSEMSQFTNENGVYQDGTLACRRDKYGSLWAILGHTHLGGISVWKGSNFDNLKKQYYISCNFKTGEAGEAYDGTCYPDGPRARGSIWPCGLWIDPSDDRFYCFFHNETGWGAGKSSYNIFGYNEGEPDFRHIGLMTSDDCGRTWDFGGWVITAHTPCWTELFRPDGVKGGQTGSSFCLGAGDFSLYVDYKEEYFYIFYTLLTHDIATYTGTDSIYVARAPISSKGLPGTWKKYYNGSFCEDGNMGREITLLAAANIPCVSFNAYLGKYLMTSYRRDCWVTGRGACQISMSEDLVNWSKPQLLCESRKDLSKPYFTICNMENSGEHSDTRKTFRLFMESNGTDIEKVDVTIP